MEWSGTAAGSAEQVISQDTDDNPDAVLPADFLALFVGAARILDADFVDASRWVEVADLGRDLGVETEPV